MTDTYLVTGAAGFIGSHSVDHLLALGHAVVGVDNLRTGHLHNLSAASRSGRLTFIEADAGDETAMASLFGDYHFRGVLHLAALVSVPESFEKPELNTQINLLTTDTIARLCLKYRCPRIVFASSAAVYGIEAELPCRESATPAPVSPYGAAKLASEVMLLGYASSYAIDAVCLRYFNIYGPRQDPGSPYSGVLSIFTDRYQQGLPVTVYGDGEQTRDFVAVADVAQANVQALTAEQVPSGRYNVCTGQALSLNQVLVYYQQLYPEVPVPSYGPARSGDIRHSTGDPAVLHAVLGLVMDTPFAQGLQALLAAHRSA